MPNNNVLSSIVKPTLVDPILSKIDHYQNSIDNTIDIKTLLKQELFKVMPQLRIPTPKVDTQINIETLNLEIGTLNMDNSKKCPIKDTSGTSDTSDGTLVLSHEDVLSNLVENFYDQTDQIDRRKYSGKYKNSPMLIKFVNE